MGALFVKPKHLIITSSIYRTNSETKSICLFPQFVGVFFLERLVLRSPTVEELVSRPLENAIKTAFLINSRIRDQFYCLQRRQRDPDFHRKKERRLYGGIRNKLLDKLGGKCTKCGFIDKRALQIDHIHGNTKREKMGRSLYKRLLDMDLDEVKKDYQVLCANCNWIKRVENKEFAYKSKHYDNN